MLGVRETAIYGTQTLADIERLCARKAKEVGLAADFRQSNMEGELVTWVQEARTKSDGIIINPGAYGHTSIALLDALPTLLTTHFAAPCGSVCLRPYRKIACSAR